jgi:hypothetical protein
MINKLHTEKIIPDCLDVPGQSMANRVRSFWPNSTIYLKKKLKIATCNSTRIETNSKILNLNEYKDTNPRMNENSKKRHVKPPNLLEWATQIPFASPTLPLWEPPLPIALPGPHGRHSVEKRVAPQSWRLQLDGSITTVMIELQTGMYDVPMMYQWCTHDVNDADVNHCQDNFNNQQPQVWCHTHYNPTSWVLLGGYNPMFCCISFKPFTIHHWSPACWTYITPRPSPLEPQASRRGRVLSKNPCQVPSGWWLMKIPWLIYINIPSGKLT